MISLYFSVITNFKKKNYIKIEILNKIKEGDEFQEVKQETIINEYI